MTERSQPTKAPATAPSVLATSHISVSKYEANPSGIVVGLTLSLSWQLAVVVLVPLLGGYTLDNHLKTGPWLTLLGFALAMLAMVAVVRRTLAQLNKFMKLPQESPENITSPHNSKAESKTR